MESWSPFPGSRTAVALLLTLAGGIAAQEPKLGPELAPAAQNDAHAEMVRLIQEIEVRLNRIDDDLSRAAAGEVELSSVAESGLGDLLRASRDEMKSVVDGIDRILAIRDHHQSSGGT